MKLITARPGHRAEAYAHLNQKLADLETALASNRARLSATEATIQELVRAIETAPHSTYLSTEALTGMLRKAKEDGGSGVDVLAAPHATWRPLRAALDQAQRLLAGAR